MSGSAGDQTKKKRKDLSPHTRELLKNWLMSPEHFYNPYPSAEEKEELLAQTGIEMKQLTNWFTNARKRIWKPMITSQAKSGSSQPSHPARLGESKGHTNSTARKCARHSRQSAGQKEGLKRAKRASAAHESLHSPPDQRPLQPAELQHEPQQREQWLQQDPMNNPHRQLNLGLTAEILDIEIPWDSLAHHSQYWTLGEKEDQITQLMETKVDSKSWSHSLPLEEDTVVKDEEDSLSSVSVGSLGKRKAEDPGQADSVRRKSRCQDELLGSDQGLQSEAVWDSNPNLKAMGCQFGWF